MTIVRILAVVSILLPGPQVIAYLIAWLIIPAEQHSEQRSTVAASS